MTKQEQQQNLLAENDFTYLGNGPQATSGFGWVMSANLYFKCVGCEYMMSGDSRKSDNCFCGAMSKDVDYGRFGSRFGDEKIEVYRISPKIGARQQLIQPKHD
ncbi:MAG: hypothetical protein ACR2N3_14070 [Pyrinomonadaceae bacterium]